MPANNNNAVHLIDLSKLPQLVALNASPKLDDVANWTSSRATLIFHHDGWITCGHTAASAMAALLITLKSKHILQTST